MARIMDVHRLARPGIRHSSGDSSFRPIEITFPASCLDSFSITFPLTHHLNDLLCPKKWCLQQRNLQCGAKRLAEDIVFAYSWQSLTWELDRTCRQRSSLCQEESWSNGGPGHQERTAKRSWLALNSEFSLTVMRNRQAGRVPELSNLCKRKSHLSLAAPPGNAGGLSGVILILFTVWHMQTTICLHGSSQHF